MPHFLKALQVGELVPPVKLSRQANVIVTPEWRRAIRLLVKLNNQRIVQAVDNSTTAGKI